jgi:hypothetical protein
MLWHLSPGVSRRFKAGIGPALPRILAKGPAKPNATARCSVWLPISDHLAQCLRRTLRFNLTNLRHFQDPLPFCRGTVVRQRSPSRNLIDADCRNVRGTYPALRRRDRRAAA